MEDMLLGGGGLDDDDDDDDEEVAVEEESTATATAAAGVLLESAAAVVSVVSYPPAATPLTRPAGFSAFSSPSTPNPNPAAVPLSKPAPLYSLLNQDDFEPMPYVAPTVLQYNPPVNTNAAAAASAAAAGTLKHHQPMGPPPAAIVKPLRRNALQLGTPAASSNAVHTFTPISASATSAASSSIAISNEPAVLGADTINSMDTSSSSSLDQKQKKERFILFTKVLMKYLETKDANMHAAAKEAIRECAQKNREGDPGMQSRLRTLLAGTTYWAKAESYLAQYLSKAASAASSSSSASTIHPLATTSATATTIATTIAATTNIHTNNNNTIDASLSSMNHTHTFMPPPPASLAMMPPPPSISSSSKGIHTSFSAPNHHTTATATRIQDNTGLSNTTNNNTIIMGRPTTLGPHHGSGTTLTQKHQHQQQQQQQHEQQGVFSMSLNKPLPAGQPSMNTSTMSSNLISSRPIMSDGLTLAAAAAAAAEARKKEEMNAKRKIQRKEAAARKKAKTDGGGGVIHHMPIHMNTTPSNLLNTHSVPFLGHGSLMTMTNSSSNNTTTTTIPPSNPLSKSQGGHIPSSSYSTTTSFSMNTTTFPSTNIHGDDTSPTSSSFKSSSFKKHRSSTPIISNTTSTTTTIKQQYNDSTILDESTQVKTSPVTLAKKKKDMKAMSSSSNTTMMTTTATMANTNSHHLIHNHKKSLEEKEVHDWMEMLDHATPIHIHSLALLLGQDQEEDKHHHSSIIRGLEEQDYSVFQKVKKQNDELWYSKNRGMIVLGWSDRNIMTSRMAFASLRLVEQEEGGETRNGSSKQDEDTWTATTTSSTTTTTHTDMDVELEYASTPVSEWFNEERAEEDAALALLSEATQLYVKSLLEKSIQSTFIRHNVDGIRLWHIQQAASLSFMNTSTTSSGESMESAMMEKKSIPPLYLRLGCDVRRQRALVDGNSAKICQRMEEALARRKGNVYSTLVKSDTMEIDEEEQVKKRLVEDEDDLSNPKSLFFATSMSDLARKPKLPSMAQNASKDAKRFFDIYGGKDYGQLAPLGRVSKNTWITGEVVMGPVVVQDPFLAKYCQRGLLMSASTPW